MLTRKALPLAQNHSAAFTSVWLQPYLLFLCVFPTLGEGQVRLQDPPAGDGGAAEEVQRQEEAEGQQTADFEAWIRN